jgi:hypothetical protein
MPSAAVASSAPAEEPDPAPIAAFASLPILGVSTRFEHAGAKWPRAGIPDVVGVRNVQRLTAGGAYGYRVMWPCHGFPPLFGPRRSLLLAEARCYMEQCLATRVYRRRVSTLVARQ